MSRLPIRVALPADFDFPWAVRFLSARAVPSLEVVQDSGYARVVWPASLVAGGTQSAGDAPIVLGMRFSPPSSTVRGGKRGRGERWRGETVGARGLLRVWSVPTLPPDALRCAVTRLFDLDADLESFRAHVADDPVVGPMVRRDRLGIRLPQLLDPFEGLVRAIVGQQVSVAAATTMAGRLVRLLGTPAPTLAGGAAPGPRLSFPRPAELLAAGTRRLRGLGFTRSKAATLLAVADAAAGGALDLARLRGAPAPEVDAALTALPGIGPWTASYVRMRAFGDRDAFPAADLGVLKALAARGIAREAAAVVAERWRPWRSYATLHLWRSLELGA